MRWNCVEAGWYIVLHMGLPAGGAVCKEDDGRWHTYVERDWPPGDSTHRTLSLAKRAVEKAMRAKGTWA